MDDNTDFILIWPAFSLKIPDLFERVRTRSGRFGLELIGLNKNWGISEPVREGPDSTSLVRKFVLFRQLSGYSNSDRELKKFHYKMVQFEQTFLYKVHSPSC